MIRLFSLLLCNTYQMVRAEMRNPYLINLRYQPVVMTEAALGVYDCSHCMQTCCGSEKLLPGPGQKQHFILRNNLYLNIEAKMNKKVK